MLPSLGTTPEHFAKIAMKNHKHSVNNPNSQFRDDYSLEEIKNSKMIYFPLTKLQCWSVLCHMTCIDTSIAEGQFQNKDVGASITIVIKMLTTN